MRLSLDFALILSSNSFSFAFAESLPLTARSEYTSTCKEIEQAISNASSVYWPCLSTEYQKDISHWDLSSTMQATCSVELGTTEDVRKTLQIVGNSNTPFAVKGGGHTMNPGFSPTRGVQIAMYRFSEVKYHSHNQTVDVGPGLVWDDVYAALEPYAVNVVGARVTGIGVAGLTLGGGYSYLTNQYGLTIDNAVGYELVLPEGKVVRVSQDSYPDLFWALKGGFNNFGIVTKFTFRTRPQTQVWGGTITFTQEHLEAINNATVKFSQTVTDPKAAIVSTYSLVNGILNVEILFFYDYPNIPAGVFDDFLSIPYRTKDVKTRTFPDLITSIPTNLTTNTRARGIHSEDHRRDSERDEGEPPFPPLPDPDNEAWLTLSAVLEPVPLPPHHWQHHRHIHRRALPASLFSHGSGNSPAYPPSRSKGLLPLNLRYTYTTEAADEMIYDAARRRAGWLTEVAQGEGQDVAHAALYGSYAIFDTPLDRIYGANVDELKAVKARYDPRGMMGLAGGFKF